MKSRSASRPQRTGAWSGWRSHRRQRAGMPGYSKGRTGALRGKTLWTMALALAGGGSVYLASHLLENSDMMPVRSIAVEGASELRAAEIRAFAEVRMGTPTFRLDLDDVARKVREHPFVATATVRRVPPDGIEIQVTERSAVAVVAAKWLYLVDAQGVPFKKAAPGDGLDLPVITGLSIDDFEDGPPELLLQALSALQAYDEAGAKGGAAQELNVEPGRGVSLVLPDRLRVVLGMGEYPRKMTWLSASLEALKARKVAAQIIHLNDEQRPQRVPVRLHPSTEMLASTGT